MQALHTLINFNIIQYFRFFIYFFSLLSFVKMLNLSLSHITYYYYESIIYLISFFIGMPDSLIHFEFVRFIDIILFCDVKHWTLFVFCCIVDLIVVFLLFYAWSAITLINLFINQKKNKNRLNYRFFSVLTWLIFICILYIYYWINTLHFKIQCSVFSVRCSQFTGAQCPDSQCGLSKPNWTKILE